MSAAAADRREGRGRLSSLETLPEECTEDLAWANAELAERRMPQTEILNQFNARLADKGVRGVSKGAFSRYSVRIAIQLRKGEAARQIQDVILRRFTAEDRTGLLLTAVELLKHRVVEIVMDEDVGLGELNKASLTLQRLSATAARAADSDRKERKAADENDEKRREREKFEAAEAKELAEADADTVAKIAADAGLSTDRIAAIRRGVLGLVA